MREPTLEQAVKNALGPITTNGMLERGYQWSDLVNEAALAVFARGYFPADEDFDRLQHAVTELRSGVEIQPGTLRDVISNYDGQVYESC